MSKGHSEMSFATEKKYSIRFSGNRGDLEYYHKSKDHLYYII